MINVIACAKYYTKKITMKRKYSLYDRQQDCPSFVCTAYAQQ